MEVSCDCDCDSFSKSIRRSSCFNFLSMYLSSLFFFLLFILEFDCAMSCLITHQSPALVELYDTYRALIPGTFGHVDNRIGVLLYFMSVLFCFTFLFTCSSRGLCAVQSHLESLDRRPRDSDLLLADCCRTATPFCQTSKFLAAPKGWRQKVGRNTSGNRMISPVW